jgi:Mg2+ and Co2+ transporter CorA
MISGRSALGFIDESLGNERSSIDTAERQIAEVSRQLLEQQQARVADYRELARLRVDMMAAGSMISSIDVVSKQVAAALEARKSIGTTHCSCTCGSVTTAHRNTGHGR